MNWSLLLACRALLWMVQKLVPESLREEWRQEWRGDLWQWTLKAARAGAPDSRFALLAHTKSAVREAWQVRFQTELGQEGYHGLIGSPAFCLGICALPVLVLGILTLGFEDTRQLIKGLPYQNPDRIVVVAQGPPILGIRLGFRDQDVAAFRKRAHTIEGIATYVWRPTIFGSGKRRFEVQAANVSPEFFKVLGVNPVAGEPLVVKAGESSYSREDSFLASYDFWKSELGGDRRKIGQLFDVEGQPMRLAGVLPREFSFLSTPISIWTTRDETIVAPGARWWLALKGTVARLRPGVAPEDAERDLRDVQVTAGLGRRDFRIKATGVEEIVYWAVRMYGTALLAAIGGVILWAVLGALRDRRRGVSWRVVRRFWGFFAIKPVLPLLGIFLFVLECTGANSLSTTGGIRGGGGLLSLWVTFCGTVVVLLLAWRDQSGRCRVCLHSMRQPVRIGVPGQMLLDTAGMEVMCPKGHGSVYTSASVLGSDISNRWMGFEEPVLDETEHRERTILGLSEPVK